jgi:hypothetical protein
MFEEKLFLKYPALPLEVSLNNNYPRYEYNSACFATVYAL